MGQTHQQIIPRRSETIKSLSFTSQFLVGMSSGGEFFDLAKSNFAVIFFSITGPSHQKLALVLDHFDQFRDSFENKTEAASVLAPDILQNFLRQLAGTQNIFHDLQLLLIGIRLQDLHFESYHFGNYCIVSGHPIELFPDCGANSNRQILPGNAHPFGQAFFPRAKYSGKMQRGEKWAIISPGINANLPGGIEQMPPQDYIAKKMQESPGAVMNHMNQVLLEMQKNSPGKFLRYDASLVSIEVNPRAILKV